MFCLEVLKLTETEYLEALNKATNGGVVEVSMELERTEKRKNRFNGESIMLTKEELSNMIDYSSTS